jgi:glutamate dehydrogenase/leucine dehydrogenase
LGERFGNPETTEEAARSMAEGDFSSLELRGPRREDVFDLYEAVDASGSRPEDHVYSCVAICRKDWNDKWPALGGTRHFQKDRELAAHEAIELAMSMYIKNSLLRKAAQSLSDASGLFDWQGGKGVVWTPAGAPLTEHRLRCHGRLIDWIGGQYVGSGDVGVGAPQLQVMAGETGHLIGLGCRRDTGEATARGIFSGIRQAVREQAAELGADPADPLQGVPILVFGAGKVGFPLLWMLHGAGAEVWVFDEYLKPGAVDAWYEGNRERQAAIGEEHRAALREIDAAGRILAAEQEALDHPRVRVISPNAGTTEWLSRSPRWDGGESRAGRLARNRAKNGKLELVLGAGNDQVSTTVSGKPERDRTLATLAAAGLVFVPDPLVSPGGVISVSHERAADWSAERVNEDAERIVERGVEQIYAESRRLGGTDAVTMYRALENLAQSDWR